MPGLVLPRLASPCLAGELLRIRHESLAAAAVATKEIEANRATLKEAGGTAAKGRASELPTLQQPATGAAACSKEAEDDGGGVAGGGGGDVRGQQQQQQQALAGLVAVERLGMVELNPGSEEWLKEVRFYGVVVYFYNFFFIILFLFRGCFL